jgi:hypothetical protein
MATVASNVLALYVLMLRQRFPAIAGTFFTEGSILLGGS